MWLWRAFWKDGKKVGTICKCVGACYCMLYQNNELLNDGASALKHKRWSNSVQCELKDNSGFNNVHLSIISELQAHLKYMQTWTQASYNILRLACLQYFSTHIVTLTTTQGQWSAGWVCLCNRWGPSHGQRVLWASHPSPPEWRAPLV